MKREAFRNSGHTAPDKAGGEKRVPPVRRHLVRAAVVAAACCLLLAGGAFVTVPRLPELRAKAATLYDSGGRLTNLKAAAPAQRFVQDCDGFGLRLLRQLSDGKSSCFLSPASVYLALGMTYNGAQGKTAEQFQKVLGGGSLAAFNQGCLGLQSLMAGDDFRLTDSIWLSSADGPYVRQSFLTADKTYFGSALTTLDFTKPAAAEAISRWVKKNTNGRLDMKLDHLDESTVMVLLNTIYFKSDWAETFEPSATQNGAFDTPTGEKTVPFMYGVRTGYFETDALQGILLPYKDGKTSLMVLLPKKDLRTMLDGLTAGQLASFVRQNTGGTRAARLSLPKLKLSLDASLADPLKALGLRDAFDPGRADFGGMVQPTMQVYISEVKHQTELTVNEAGTEAAAATAVQMEKASIVDSTGLPEMDVNRAFLAAIVNNETGAALFLGAVTDPGAS